MAGSLVNSVLAEGAGFISLTVPNPIVPLASPGITGSSSVSISSLSGPDIGAVPLTEVNRIRESVSVPVLGVSTVRDGPISSDSRPPVGYSLTRMTRPELSLCYSSAGIRQSGVSPSISGRPPLVAGVRLAPFSSRSASPSGSDTTSVRRVRVSDPLPVSFRNQGPLQADASLLETSRIPTSSSNSVSSRIGTAVGAGPSVAKRRRLTFSDPDPVPARNSAPLQAGTFGSERRRSLPNPDPVLVGNPVPQSLATPLTGRHQLPDTNPDSLCVPPEVREWVERYEAAVRHHSRLTSMGRSHPPVEELDASSSEDEIVSVADSHVSLFESHPSLLSRNSDRNVMRDPSQVDASADFSSDGDEPEVVVELPLAKRVTGLFHKYVPDVGVTPETSEGRKGFFAGRSKAVSSFQLRVQDIHKEEFVCTSSRPKKASLDIRKQVSGIFVEGDDGLLTPKSISPEVLKLADMLETGKNSLLKSDKGDADVSFAITGGLRLSVLNDMLLELLAGSQELDISPPDQAEILLALREVSSLLFSQIAAASTLVDNARRVHVLETLHIKQSLIPDMVKEIDVSSPFLCGNNLADILQKEVDSRKKAKELSTSIRDVRQTPSSSSSAKSGFFKAPLFRRGKKKKDKKTSVPARSTPAAPPQDRRVADSSHDFYDRQVSFQDQTPRRGRGSGRGSSRGVAKSQPFRQGGKHYSR